MTTSKPFKWTGRWDAFCGSLGVYGCHGHDPAEIRCAVTVHNIYARVYYCVQMTSTRARDDAALRALQMMPMIIVADGGAGAKPLGNAVRCDASCFRSGPKNNERMRDICKYTHTPGQ